MAARIGMTVRALQSLDPAACDTDARLVWKDGDSLNLGIVLPPMSGDPQGRFVQGIVLGSPRELRLLGAQMLRRADDLERGVNEVEVVIP